MLSRIRPHLSFANVVSLLALFVALGGSATAAIIVSSNSQVAKNSISGHHPPAGDHPNIIANSITGADVLESTLGKVPAAAESDHATTANQATSAGTADHATTANQATTAGTATSAGNGAISINTSVGYQSSGTLTSANGVNVGYSCDKASGGNSVSVEVGAPPTAVFISGDKAEDGTLTSIQTTDTEYYASTGTSTANLDVIAMNPTIGKWARFDLGGFWGSQGCNLWGVIIPGA